MTTATYAIDQSVHVLCSLTDAEYERCCAMARMRPTTGNRFQLATDEDLFALQNYLVEQRLPHRIITTKEWRP